MIFQVIRENGNGASTLIDSFGSRELAERYIARKGKRKRSAAEQKKLHIEEKEISPDHPYFRACRAASEALPKTRATPKVESV